jgi:hypothetical protein
MTRSTMAARDLPLTICVGAARAGTTTLYALMQRHPSVCVSNKKETEFFWHEQHVKGRDFYLRKYFPHFESKSMLFEASPIYMYRHVCIERIRKDCADARIVVMLRNPVDRAFSDYLFFLSYAYYDEPFERLCESDLGRLHDVGAELDFKSLDRSRYSGQIRNILRYFPREQVHFVIFEDLMRDQREGFRALQQRLGLPSTDVENVRTNEASRPRCVPIARLLYNPKWRTFRKNIRRITGGIGAGLLHSASSVLNRKSFADGEKPRLAPLFRSQLLRAFENEIADVETLIGVDLSCWRDTNRNVAM